MYTKETFIEKSEKLFPGKFNYSLVDYKDYYSPVKLICKECGSVIEMSPNCFWRFGACCSKKYKK